jgi:hypothetical protein
MPPPGQCRVWYDSRPPGQQPRPVDCDTAERVASRDRNARVIYGNAGWQNGRVDQRGPIGQVPRTRPRAIPRPPATRGGGYGYGYDNIAFDRGFRDGLEKGREDARDNDSYDPVRHRWYRNADRGYEGRYGNKDSYRLVYRDGFERGYDQGYRDNQRRGGWWPF